MHQLKLKFIQIKTVSLGQVLDAAFVMKIMLLEITEYAQKWMTIALLERTEDVLNVNTDINLNLSQANV
jgi:hypothetical protein